MKKYQRGYIGSEEQDTPTICAPYLPVELDNQPLHLLCAGFAGGVTFTLIVGGVLWGAFG